MHSSFKVQSGLTLIEVVVSIALIGTLLSTAILASSSHLAQAEAAHRKLLASKCLDQFVSNWNRQGLSVQAVEQFPETLLYPDRDQAVSFRLSISKRRLPKLDQAQVVRLALTATEKQTHPDAWVEVIVAAERQDAY